MGVKMSRSFVSSKICTPCTTLWGNVIGVAGFKDLVLLPRLPIHETAGDDIADLLVGMGVGRADSALFKYEFAGHEIPAVGQNLARYAAAEITGGDVLILRKHITTGSR